MSSDRLTPPDVTTRPFVARLPIVEGRLAGGDAARRVLAAVLSVYFWPTIVAAEREHRELDALASLNVMLGWTVVGWLAALAWAYRGRSI